MKNRIKRIQIFFIFVLFCMQSTLPKPTVGSSGGQAGTTVVKKASQAQQRAGAGRKGQQQTRQAATKGRGAATKTQTQAQQTIAAAGTQKAFDNAAQGVVAFWDSYKKATFFSDKNRPDLGSFLHHADQIKALQLLFNDLKPYIDALQNTIIIDTYEDNVENFLEQFIYEKSAFEHLKTLLRLINTKAPMMLSYKLLPRKARAAASGGLGKRVNAGATTRSVLSRLTGPSVTAPTRTRSRSSILAAQQAAQGAAYAAMSPFGKGASYVSSGLSSTWDYGKYLASSAKNAVVGGREFWLPSQDELETIKERLVRLQQLEIAQSEGRSIDDALLEKLRATEDDDRIMLQKWWPWVLGALALSTQQGRYVAGSLLSGAATGAGAILGGAATLAGAALVNPFIGGLTALGVSGALVNKLFSSEPVTNLELQQLAAQLHGATQEILQSSEDLSSTQKAQLNTFMKQLMQARALLKANTMDKNEAEAWLRKVAEYLSQFVKEDEESYEGDDV